MEKRGQIRKFMKSKLAKVILITLVVFVIALIFKVNPASSSSIDEKRSEVDQLQNQIDHYQGLANEKAGQIESLEAQVARMNAEIKITELNIEKTQKKADLTQVEINETKEKIKEKEKELAYQKSVLDEALRVIYEEGNAGFLESFLTAETLADLMDRTEYLDAVSNKIEITMGKIEAIRADLLAKKNDLEGKKRELTELLKDQEAVQLSLIQQRQEKDDLLQTTQGKQAVYEASLGRVKEVWESANSELKRMEESAHDDPGAPSADGFYWPINGRRGCPFGYSECYCFWDGKKKICRFHSGIDIISSCGTRIVASKSGTVTTVEDGYNNTYPYSYIYGNYVKIDHGGGFETVYGHLLKYKIRVRKGSRVIGGQTVIGYEGNSGYSTGCHLHFEVRYNGNVIDPMRYLP